MNRLNSATPLPTAPEARALPSTSAGTSGSAAEVRVGRVRDGRLVLRQTRLLAETLTNPRVARQIHRARALRQHCAPVARATGRAARVAAQSAVAAPAPVAGRMAGRFVAGRMLNGQPRTDATFWRQGRHQLKDVPGESRRWSYMPGWQRSALRVSGSSSAWAALHVVAPAPLDAATTGAGAVAALWGGWAAARWYQTREHRTRYLLPLHHALRGAVGTTATRPEQWLHVPSDFKSNPGRPIRIDLPAHFDGSDGTSQHVKTVVKGKLGLPSDTVVAFANEGDKPYVLFTEPPRPPKTVGLAELMPLLKKSRETAPIIGLTAGGRPVTVDLEADSPHVLLSAGTGAGKSVLLRAILAQALAKGAYGIILDVKQLSHPWARNLPNVGYYRAVEAIHEQLLYLQDQVERRNALALAGADEDGNTDHVDVGPRIFVLAEEMNATVNKLQRYWRKIKQKGDPNTSPAIEALQDLLFMGRQIKIHVIAVAQMASARSMGGPEARENYATRCLARYTNNNWKMLVPEIWPPPKKTKHVGRWQIVQAGVATETQVVFLTSREARDLALAGLDPARPASPEATATAAPSPSPRPVPTPRPAADTPSPVSAEAGDIVDADLVPETQVNQPTQVNQEPGYLGKPPGSDLGQPIGTSPGPSPEQPAPPSGGPGRGLYVIPGGRTSHTAQTRPPAPPTAPATTPVDVAGEDRGVGLSEAADLLDDDVTIHVLRNGRKRDPQFPRPLREASPGVEARYRFRDIELWALNRVKTTPGN